MIADKGFSVAKVFQHNTERGVATVISHKRSGGDGMRHDQDTLRAESSQPWRWQMRSHSRPSGTGPP